MPLWLRFSTGGTPLGERQLLPRGTQERKGNKIFFAKTNNTNTFLLLAVLLLSY